MSSREGGGAAAQARRPVPPCRGSLGRRWHSRWHLKLRMVGWLKSGWSGMGENLVPLPLFMVLITSPNPRHTNSSHASNRGTRGSRVSFVLVTSLEMLVASWEEVVVVAQVEVELAFLPNTLEATCVVVGGEGRGTSCWSRLADRPCATRLLIASSGPKYPCNRNIKETSTSVWRRMGREGTRVRRMMAAIREVKMILELVQ